MRLPRDRRPPREGRRRDRSSPDAAFFLDENSPAYFGTVGQFMLDDGLVSCFADVAALARKGGTLLNGQGTVEPDDPLWVDFARSMVPLMMPSAEFIAGLITRTTPRTSRCGARHRRGSRHVRHQHRDQASGCRDRGARLARGAGRGRQNADRFGVTSGSQQCRQRVDQASARGRRVLLTNFLPASTGRPALTCFARSRRSRRGRARSRARVRAERGPVSPPDQAFFAMIMLATTAAGDAYTFSELRAWQPMQVSAVASFPADHGTESVVVSTQ